VGGQEVAVTRLRAPFAALLFVGCSPTLVEPESAADALGDRAAACDPEMSVFPVGDAHNIGYDSASCGTGTCEITCPDDHANSDWGGDHHGIVVFAYQRAPLVAVADGQIMAVGTPSSTSGLRVRLQDACGWQYYYGHMDQAVVSVGQWVRAGDLVGYMGRTGTASTHLHFNVSPWGEYSNDVNPFPLLDATSPTACDAPAPEPEPEPVLPPVDGCGALLPQEGLGANEVVPSCDGRFDLVMQGDGNLVLYQGARALWHTSTHGNPGATAAMQGDGNLVVYAPSGRALWNSRTHGHPGASLAVQDDGNVVIYERGRALWSSGTCCH
jgi:hypothetical protein